jgi:hypothetical protein
VPKQNYEQKKQFYFSPRIEYRLPGVPVGRGKPEASPSCRMADVQLLWCREMMTDIRRFFPKKMLQLIKPPRFFFSVYSTKNEVGYCQVLWFKQIPKIKKALVEEHSLIWTGILI